MIDTTILTLEKMKSANDYEIQMLMIDLHLSSIFIFNAHLKCSMSIEMLHTDVTTGSILRPLQV